MSSYSKAIPYVIGACCFSDGDTHQVDEVIVTKLKMAVKVARVSSNVSLIETILLTVGELGRCVNNVFLRCVNNVFLRSVNNVFLRCVNNVFLGRCVNNVFLGRCVNNLFLWAGV